MYKHGWHDSDQSVGRPRCGFFGPLPSACRAVCPGYNKIIVTIPKKMIVPSSRLWAYALLRNHVNLVSSSMCLHFTFYLFIIFVAHFCVTPIIKTATFMPSRHPTLIWDAPSQHR